MTVTVTDVIGTDAVWSDNGDKKHPFILLASLSHLAKTFVFCKGMMLQLQS